MERKTVKIKEAAEMLSLDPSTISRYGKRGRLLLIAGGLVNVESIEAFANGENRTWQSDQRIRRVGVAVEVSAGMGQSIKNPTEHGESKSKSKGNSSDAAPLIATGPKLFSRS
jgi:hypothetical protein